MGGSTFVHQGLHLSTEGPGVWRTHEDLGRGRLCGTVYTRTWKDDRSRVTPDKDSVPITHQWSLLYGGEIRTVVEIPLFGRKILL